MSITHHRFIGFKGKAGAGKTTATDVLVGLLTNQKKHATRMSFASPLKALCHEVFSIAFNVGPEAFYGSQDQKNADLDQLPGWSGRKILQHIGTEGFRHISPEIWPNYAINAASSLIDSTEMNYVVFDDVRFVSEAAAIQRAGGVVIGLSGGHTKQNTAPQGIVGHASEADVDLIKPDYTINNEGSIKDLTSLLEAML